MFIISNDVIKKMFYLHVLFAHVYIYFINIRTMPIVGYCEKSNITQSDIAKKGDLLVKWDFNC